MNCYPGTNRSNTPLIADHLTLADTNLRELRITTQKCRLLIMCLHNNYESESFTDLSTAIPLNTTNLCNRLTADRARWLWYLTTTVTEATGGTLEQPTVRINEKI